MGRKGSPLQKLLAVSALAMALSLGLPAAVSASSPQQVTFGQTVTSDVFVSARPAGASGNTRFVDVATGEFTGAVVGAFTETDYFLLHADGTGNFHGVDTCTCTIDGRSGILVIRYTGTMAADGTFVSPFVILRGDGGLAGIKGEGVSTGVYIGVTPYSFTNILQYQFTSGGR